MRVSTSVALIMVVALSTLAIAQVKAPTAPGAKPAAPATAAPAKTPAVAAPATKPAAPPAKPATPAANPEEKAIRQVVDSVLKAYNGHDAKALAVLFTTDGEITDQEAVTFHGREAIEEVFAAVFEQYPEAKMEVAIDSIRFLSPTVAIEEGVSKIVHEPGQTPEPLRYNVVHVKQDGKWLMASAHDMEDNETTATAELEQLAWLIGDWVDEDPSGLVRTSYRWTDNQKFILGDFTLQISGRPTMTGTQRIGWDPLAKKIRSWVFDSEGGFAEGLWTRQQTQWIVKQSGVTRDGDPASATNVFTRLGDDRYSFESHDRVVGEEILDDSGDIVVVRVPPQPGKKKSKP